jgi:aldose 1-epimerase
MAAKPLGQEALVLQMGESRCEILPQIGGSIAGWTVQGQSLLRGAAAASVAAADPFGMATFPLVPYSNRIGNAEFFWENKVIRLVRNFPPELHSIHGVGFMRAWSVLESGPNSALLQVVHKPDDRWPFAFEARQRIALTRDSLSLELIAVNLAGHRAPLAFGHHPYIPWRDAQLQFRARRVWLVDDEGLPSLSVRPFDKFDFCESRPVSRGDIDHCYSGWDGNARVFWPGKKWALSLQASQGLRHAVVCIRGEEETLCFEPVPHMNNAINRPEAENAMPQLAAGESLHATIVFTAEERPL